MVLRLLEEQISLVVVSSSARHRRVDRDVQVEVTIRESPTSVGTVFLLLH